MRCASALRKFGKQRVKGGLAPFHHSGHSERSQASILTCPSESPGRLYHEGVAAAGSVVDPNAFRLQIPLDRLCAILATETGGLVAAEWHQEAHRPIGVHPHRAGLDAGGHRVRALEGLRPNAGAESVCDVVGYLHRLFLVLELDDRQNGTEHLLLRNAHLVTDAREDGRLDEILAATLLLGGWPAPKYALRALLLGDVDVGENLLVLRRGRHRTYLRLGQRRIAEAGRLGHGN